MSNYSALIDPSDFGLIADYLRSPSAPIDYLLHIKSADSLAPLAEALEREQHRIDISPGHFPDAIKRGLADGSLRISCRHQLDSPNPRQWIDARAIPREASCRVLYCPPFYLVHTPGLFEGTLVRQDARENCAMKHPSTPRARMKF